MRQRRRFLFVYAVMMFPGVVPAQDYGGDMPRQLTVLVRDTPPDSAPDSPAKIRQRSDNSYSVSTETGNGGSSDGGGNDGYSSDEGGNDGANPPSGSAGAGNGYSVSTDQGNGGGVAQASNGRDGSTTVTVNTHITRYNVVEGEVVQMNLPSVQSLQFYAPIAGVGMAPGAAQGIGPGVGGVVFFPGVSAFSVRFAVQGREVVADLLPQQIGGVAAPYGYGVQDKPRPFRIRGPVGQWIELGEPGTQTTQTLGSVPDGAPPTGVWVKVLPHG